MLDTRPAQTHKQDAPRKRQRLAALDQIRGMAIIGVVAFHVIATVHRGHKHLPFFLWPVAAGRLGVDAFFVLSGFVIIRTFKGGSWRYFVRRAQRLFPAYWASLVVFVALGGRHLFTSLHGIGTLLLHATGQQFMTPMSSWVINSSYWTLTPQIHFFLLAPLLVLVLRRLSPTTALLIFVGISVAFRILLHSPWQWPADTIVGRIDQFVVGMTAAKIASRSTSQLRWLRSRAAVSTATVGLVTVVFFYGSLFPGPSLEQKVWTENIVHPVFALLLGVCLLRLPSDEASSLPGRALAGLGVISYSVYLWHLPILMWFGRAGAPGFVAAIAATLIVATVSYFVLERPGKLGRHRRGNLRQRDQRLGEEVDPVEEPKHVALLEP